MGQKDRKTESLNLGLVNSRDPALLEPGELSDMRNAMYLPNSQALQRATGRVPFGQVFLPTVVPPTLANSDLSPIDTNGAHAIGGSFHWFANEAQGSNFFTAWQSVLIDNSPSDTDFIYVNNVADVNEPFNVKLGFPTLSSAITAWTVRFKVKLTSAYAGNAVFSATLRLSDGNGYAVCAQAISALTPGAYQTLSYSFDTSQGAIDTGTLNSLSLNFHMTGQFLPGFYITYLDVIPTSGVSDQPALDVVGIRDQQFDNGNHYLTVHASSLYATAIVGDSGTFASALSVTPGTSLESIHYDNEFYILNGTAADLTTTSLVALNEVMYLSATATATKPSWRTHGLNPVATGPGITTATGGTFSATATGYYEYWSTEVFQYTKDSVVLYLESTFDGTPSTVFINTTGMYPTIHQPARVNANSNITKWRIYRSPAKEVQSIKDFPLGSLIAELPTTDATFDDKIGAGSNYLFSASAVNEAGTAWINPTNVFADDNVTATITLPAATNTGGGGFISSTGWLRLSNFTGLQAAITNPVYGIEAVIEVAKNSGTAACTLELQLIRATDGLVLTKGVPITGALGVAVLTIGGPNDLWGVGTEFGITNVAAWTAADFADGTFGLRIRADNANIGSGGSFAVDYATLKVYSGGTTDAIAGTDDPFPAIIIEQSGLQTSIGSHGKPPVANTGDIFQGSLVLNDVTHPSFIRYSLPLEPDYFPSVYFIDFETSDNDIVTNIKTLNNRLGVFLRSSLYRVNYLPNENDATFDRGRAFDAVSYQYGCYNSQCACTFTAGDGRTRLAYVSDHGIHSTDLMVTDNLTDDLDWRKFVATTGSNPICLVNDPDKWELLFYYKNTTVTDNEQYRCLHLSYHPSHIKNEKPKVSGQVHMRNYDLANTVYASLECAWVTKRTTGSTSVYLGYGGLTATATAAGAGEVFIETGTVIPAFDPNFQFTTRRMYLNGFGREFRLNELYAYVPSASGTPALAYTPLTVKTNDPAGEVAKTSKAYIYDSTILHKVQFNQTAEGLRINCIQTASANAIKYEFLILDGEDFGAEDAGR